VPKASPPAAPARAAPLAISGVFALRAACATPARARPFPDLRELPFFEVAAGDALEPLDERDFDVPAFLEVAALLFDAVLFVLELRAESCALFDFARVFVAAIVSS
jgi:hypothetical protein